MIPLRDNNPARSVPVVTILLIITNVIVFILDQVSRVSVAYTVFSPVYGSVQQMHYIGGLSNDYAMVPRDITSDFVNNWPTIFYAMFLHANWLHIGGNMLYLWIFGKNIEATLGWFRYILFYAICGVGAAMAQIFMGPQSNIPTVGASGAIAGVMGAYLVLFPGASILSIVPLFIISTLMDVPAIIVIGFWAVLQFMNANWFGGGAMSGGGVAYFAHIGGFVVGIVIILLLGGKKLLRKRRPYYES